MGADFSLLNKYYDKVYVLSVENAAARRQLFNQRFKGLDYKFYFGADKNKFRPEDLIANNIYSDSLTKKNHRYSKLMKPGEIACSWSHKMIYEEIIANNFSRVLIFEDDAVPDPAMMNNIADILTEVPDDCELLMWGWAKNGESKFTDILKQGWYHVQHAAGFLKWDHTVIQNMYAKPFSAHLKKAGFHDFTYAYAISRSAAEKLVAMQTPIQYIADNLLAYAATKKIISAYITWPAVFLHDTLPDGTPRDSYIR